MSKLEERIQQQLAKNKLRFELHKPVPLETYPWQTNRSKIAPKCY